MILESILQGARRSGIYIGSAVCGAVLILFMNLYWGADEIGVSVISVLVFFYFIVFPALCIAVNVVVEYRNAKRAGSSQ